MTQKGTGHTAWAKAAERGGLPGKPRERKAAGRVARVEAFRWEGEPPEVVIGIDPGVNTGVAFLWPAGFTRVESMPIHEALEIIRATVGHPQRALIVVEDARMAKGGGNTWDDPAKWAARRKGVGSVCRDSGIWADFLDSLPVKWHPVSPMSKGPKLNDKQFARRFWWTARSNQDARDAACVADLGARLAGMKVDYLTGAEAR